MYCTLNEYVDVQAVLDYVRTVLLTFCLLREARLISPFRFVDCPLLASRRDAESKTTPRHSPSYDNVCLIPRHEHCANEP